MRIGDAVASKETAEMTTRNHEKYGNRSYKRHLKTMMEKYSFYLV